MAHCPKCGKFVNNAGEVCGSCQSAMRDAAELTRLQMKETKKRLRESKNNGNGGTRFHFLYCLCIGWWLSMFLVCMIFPLFFSGGRRLIKKSFGIW